MTCADSRVSEASPVASQIDVKTSTSKKPW